MRRMPHLVADTDVNSYRVRRDTRAALYEHHLRGHIVAASFMTVAELRRLPLQNDWGEGRRADLEEHIAGLVVIHSDDDLCHWWARLRTEAFRRGQPVPPSDAWIAATALMLGVPLITHNARHFATVPGLTLITEGP